MKNIFALSVLLLFLSSSFPLNAQVTTASQWAWMKGDTTTNAPGVYGTQGVAADSAKPGARGGGCPAWKDTSGNLWLFGGYYSGTAGNGWYNDVWKYNTATSQWAWIKGAATIGQYGVYGTKGTPAPANLPGGRYQSGTWTDTAGNFWMFGGYGYPATYVAGQYINLNDLWRYTPATNEWTWMNGSNNANMQGVYGTQGVPAAANTPGARLSTYTWTDAAGKFWLFGGRQDASAGSSFFNDLWKYDPATNQWTWVKGPNTTDQPGVYGTTGIPAAANIPGARAGGHAWVDAAGNLWLFGGGPTTGNFYNDLWKYNPATNEWACISGTNATDQPGVYGTQGAASATNKPGARGGGISWADATGNFYLFGGYGSAATTIGYLNDVWSYNPASGVWTWLKGANTAGQQGIYNTQGTANAANRPGARSPGAGWVDSTGSFWLFGGAGGGFRNDLWKLNSNGNSTPVITSKWAWIKGDNTINQQGIYGTQGVPAAANKPTSKTGGFSWKDNTGSLWLFGGTGIYSNANGPGNDLWKYNPSSNQWAWMNGSNSANQPGTYGIKGVAGPANTPGARYSGVTWTDTAGNFWLFGGSDYYGANGGRSFNDLWKYIPATNQWTWMSGDSSQSAFYGVYGTKGVPAAANKPGVRYGSTGWVDATGNLWLFGGQGAAAQGTGGSLNDLWKYNPATNQWAWMGGSNLVEQSGTYGTQGIPAAANTPGSRYGSVSWYDTSGALWLFGGSYFYNSGASGSFNDLWKYNTATNQWAWMNGASTTNQPGVYGTMGTAASANTPGARNYSVAWKDAAGDFWLMGGEGYATTTQGLLNDLWKYTAATNQWAWMDGSATVNQPGVYGTQGVAATGNIPGARVNSVSWADAAGNFWLMGGYGYATNGVDLLNDLWKLNQPGLSSNVSINGGSWNNPATWASGVVPSANSIVVVRHAITVQANANCYSLKIEGPNGSVTVATGVQFTVLH